MKNTKVLTSYWFIAALIVLLLNDFVFKGVFGNWFTGKLSDFAGLLIFPAFWTALFPNYKNGIFVFTGLFFIFWKSSLSQGFIDGWNTAGLLEITRVIDYTDLIALISLPIAYQLESRDDKFRKMRMQPVLPLVLASFAFMATSTPPKEASNPPQKKKATKGVQQDSTSTLSEKDKIQSKLDQLSGVSTE